MGKFKIGDRVKVIDYPDDIQQSSFIGAFGTIVSCVVYYRVVFDEIRGYSDQSDFEEYELELI